MDAAFQSLKKPKFPGKRHPQKPILIPAKKLTLKDHKNEQIDMERKFVREILAGNHSGETLVKGWVRTRRDSKGGFSFLEINDGSCQSNLQVVADGNLSNYQSEVLRLYVGSSVEVVGRVQKSEGGKQNFELLAEQISVLGLADPESNPVGKQRVSFELLRDIPHLRTRTNTFGAVFRLRNALSFAIHRFFQERKFLYVQTPIITASDCEGAGEMFQVTTLDLEKLKNEKTVDYQKDFFSKPSYLTVSGQLELESYACSLGNVYTFGPTFRAENSHTSRHLSEFWMVEPEMAFAELEDDMALAEDFLKYVFKAALEECGEDMAFFEARIKKGIVSTLESLVESKFNHLTYTEAVAELEKSGEKFEYPIKWGMDLQSEHERFLTEQICKGPAIITNYPKDIKAFYMKLGEDGKTVRAMDVLLPQVGEIIGGAQREDRLELLENRMRASGIEPESMSWYLDLRRFGSVPHAGFGLGFERLVQFCSGMTNIRDVIPFPRTPGNFSV